MSDFSRQEPPGDTPSYVSGTDPFAALAAGSRSVLSLLGLASERLKAVDALLLLAIVQANVSHFGANPRLQLQHMRADDAPPDALRRPVSVLAIADSLGLPFETTRRRIRRLACKGLCRIDRGGCIVPVHVLSGPRYEAIAEQAWLVLEQFCADLGAAGVVPELTGRRVPQPRSLMRLAARVLGDHVIRTVSQALPRDGDLLDRLIIMTFQAHRVGPGHLGVSRVGPARIGRSTGSDFETARRRLEGLVARGVLTKTDRTWQISEGAQDALATVAEAHLVSVRRMLATMQRLSVLHTVR